MERGAGRAGGDKARRICDVGRPVPARRNLRFVIIGLLTLILL
jgi:hypothetical protein